MATMTNLARTKPQARKFTFSQQEKHRGLLVSKEREDAVEQCKLAVVEIVKDCLEKNSKFRYAPCSPFRVTCEKYTNYLNTGISNLTFKANRTDVYMDYTVRDRSITLQMFNVLHRFSMTRSYSLTMRSMRTIFSKVLLGTVGSVQLYLQCLRYRAWWRSVWLQ